MTGKELFEYYTLYRDYSGDERDEYAQTLFTALLIVGEGKLYRFLEDAEEHDKKIRLVEDKNVDGAPYDIELI